MPGVVSPGTMNQTLFNHVDLFPTLAGLVGTGDRLPERISGLDLSRCVVEGAPGPRFTIAFDNVYRDGSGCGQVMARSARYKLLRYDAPDPAQRYVLYDMEEDAAETRNLAYDEAFAGVVREHEAAIDAWFANLKPPLYPVRTVKEDLEADRSGAD
jgi:choline-sulfatase